MANPPKKPRTRLRDTVTQTEPTIGDLPLVHTSDAYRLQDILTAKSLLPTLCNVFEEELLYLFLGRPAYRTRKQTNDNIHFDLPVVIILKPEASLPTPKRIFPFDTGAFSNHFYDRYFHPDTNIFDFEIGVSLDDARRFASHLYSTNREYFIGATRKNVEVPFGQFELEGLYELARAPADPSLENPVPPDERSSSIELQFDREIPLKGNILAIVIPQQYLDDSDVVASIRSLDPLHIETYEVISKMGARELAGSIYEIVRQIYKKSGYLP